MDENELEAKAQRILKHLKSPERYDPKFLPRPFILEFTGSPSSGKTTTITELDKFLRRQGFRVWRPQEGAEVIRHIPRTTPLYNIRTGLYALQIVLDESYGHKYDIVILDRGLFDVYCWMMYWGDKKKLTVSMEQTIQDFFLSELTTSMIDIAYFMVCDPQESMRREQQDALSHKLGETTNPTTIKQLMERYAKAYSDLRKTYPQLNFMDTSKLNRHEMIERIAAHVLDELEKKANTL